MQPVWFSEEQKFPVWWQLLFWPFLPLFIWFFFVLGDEILGNIWIALGFFLSAFAVLVGGLVMMLVRLHTRVDASGVSLKMGFAKKHIPFDAIVQAEVRIYAPIREYGGWGWRYSPSRGWAWNISGNEGVQLEFEKGKPFLIGSLRAGALMRAIQRGRDKADQG